MKAIFTIAATFGGAYGGTALTIAAGGHFAVAGIAAVAGAIGAGIAAYNYGNFIGNQVDGARLMWTVAANQKRLGYKL